MGESVIDFVRDGEVGDKVHSLRFGDGYITLISRGNCIIEAEFEAGIKGFRTCGRVAPVDKHPSLSWGHKEDYSIDQGTPPSRESGTLVFDGTPVWAWVCEKPDDVLKRFSRFVVASTSDGQFIAISDMVDNINCEGVTVWEYAWEIEDE